MTEQYLNSENEEVAPPETDLNVEQSEESNFNAEQLAKEQAKERDFRAMRQRQKELELEIQRRDELIDRFLKQTQTSVPEIVEEEEPDEEYVPAGKVKKIANRTMQPLEKKIADLEAKIAQQEQQKLYQSLLSKYPDFDDVVNMDTLAILDKQEPELAATIAQFKDPYKMGLQSYKYIKALGLAEKVPQAKRSREVVQKLDKNSKEVQTPQAYDKRPMAQAFNITQAEQTRLYEEMMHYAKKANGL